MTFSSFSRALSLAPAALLLAIPLYDAPSAQAGGLNIHLRPYPYPTYVQPVHHVQPYPVHYVRPVPVHPVIVPPTQVVTPVNVISPIHAQPRHTTLVDSIVSGAVSGLVHGAIHH